MSGVELAFTNNMMIMIKIDKLVLVLILFVILKIKIYIKLQLIIQILNGFLEEDIIIRILL